MISTMIYSVSTCKIYINIACVGHVFHHIRLDCCLQQALLVPFVVAFWAVEVDRFVGKDTIHCSALLLSTH